MPPVNFAQSSVAVNPRAGIPGMLFSADPRDYTTVTRIATVDIPFGSYVVFDGENCFLASSSAQVAGREGGIAIRSHTYASESGYKANDPVSVLVKGDAYVSANGVVTGMDHLYVKVTTFGSGAVGEFAVNPSGAAYAPNVRAVKNNVSAALGAGPTGATLVRVLGSSDGFPTGAAGASS
jgi:hypothetical protein